MQKCPGRRFLPSGTFCLVAVTRAQRAQVIVGGGDSRAERAGDRWLLAVCLSDCHRDLTAEWMILVIVQGKAFGGKLVKVTD